ncbi:MAG TPA: penicillin acylase family protein [Burkholderiaceae bacterium]|nr:penicillin acylase family protein [Burkholderiaceae bacterium]
MRHCHISLMAACALVFAQAQAQPGASAIALPGLKAATHVTRDAYGIAHVQAVNEHDLYFMQGYVHAQDRLFQMDVARRRPEGTLAELLGMAALPGDVELRTLGIRRAAERSLPLLSPDGRAAFEAYAEGVNAYVSRSHALPPEYAALEITRFRPWTALDSMTVAKSLTFSLSFSLQDIANTLALQAYSAVFDPLFGPGTGQTLFSEDLWRSQPFYLASTVPDASVGARPLSSARPVWSGTEAGAAARLGKKYVERVHDLPFFKQRLARHDRAGSNEWAVSGVHTTSGRPLIANDPHLALGEPSTFYPIHLKTASSDTMGSGFAGVPFVVAGQTRSFAWGTTVSPLDVTDVFEEQLVSDPGSPSGFSTMYMGRREPVIALPERYRVNHIGDGIPDNLTDAPSGSVPPATLIVPRRNNGPIVQLDAANGVALSIQYTGFSATREADAFLAINRSRNLGDFRRALQWFDAGNQNFAYADVEGNIAYFATSEVPVREDLQQGFVAGLPPWFVRSGSGGNEWLAVRHPQPGQAIPYEILPDGEMPHLVNPPAGWFVNANNDPAATVLDNRPLNQLRPGGGLYYLNEAYDAGLRAGRITELLRTKLSRGRVSRHDMQSIQADVVLPDAQFFVPLLHQALSRADVSLEPALAALAQRPDVREAIARLGAWKLTAPTGIPEGYDAKDVNGSPGMPSPAEISESVAATLYSVWRGQFIRNTIDATLAAVPLPPGMPLPKPEDQFALTALKGLLERPQPGVGASGIDFFNAPAAAAVDRRDILILKSMADALGLLSGPEFEAAFRRSTRQDDYRWGKLHRIVFRHPMGGPFDVPPAFGTLVHPLGEALPGFSSDGGYGAVDASNHDVRAQSASAFMFDEGPVNRFVAEADGSVMRAWSAWPGGTSGIPGSPFYLNLLGIWLTNDTVPLLFTEASLQQSMLSVSRFVPGR